MTRTEHKTYNLNYNGKRVMAHVTWLYTKFWATYFVAGHKIYEASFLREPTRDQVQFQLPEFLIK